MSYRIRAALAVTAAVTCITGAVTTLPAVPAQARPLTPAAAAALPPPGTVIDGDTLVPSSPAVLNPPGPAFTSEPQQPPLAAPAWPGAGTADLALRPGQPGTPGGLPLSVMLAGPAPAGQQDVPVQVSELSQAQVQAMGGQGIAFQLTRTTAGGTPVPVQVTADYGGFAQAYGGNFASRLVLAQLPACAIATPQDPACTASPSYLPDSNDPAAGTITATVDAAPQAQQGQEPVYVLMSAPSGHDGTYRATDLRQSQAWDVGLQAGDFTYSYPVPLPTPPVGTAPDLELDYDSASVDGMTSATNPQAGWAGIGWDLSAPYIQRIYTTCAATGDDCWHSPDSSPQHAEYQLSMGGESTGLVQDSSGTWHAQDDDGWKIEDHTGGPNADRYGQYWMLIAPDGTSYRFGYDSDANWTEPVVSPSVGQPCYNGRLQPCTRTWRWNLDTETDPDGNAITYSYTTETNYYRRTGTSSDVEYVRGGFLHDVTYGGAAGAASDQAEFFYEPRCTELATMTPAADAECPEIDKEHASSYPDVPMDLLCGKGQACSEHSPSFFITSRLNYIQTQVWDGRVADDRHWANVTRIQAGMTFPKKNDGTSPDLWLQSLQVTGDYHGTVLMPATVFAPVGLINRVDYNSRDKGQLEFDRVSKIQGQLGTDTTVAYGHATDAAACPSGGETAAGYQQWLAGKKWDQNTQECFRQFYSPQPGQPGQWGIFQKYVVKTVTTQDLPKDSDLEQTTYQYQGDPAWHFGQDPLTPDQYQSWNQWRGYGTVRVIYGDQQKDAPPQQLNVTDTSFFRGMDGDRMADGTTRKASVTDFAANTWTDSDWLDGEILQVRQWQDNGDGSLTAKSSERYTYWAAETARPGGQQVPAWMVRPEGDYVTAPMLDGQQRTSWTITDGYSTGNAGLATRSTKYGDGTDWQCTTTLYAQNRDKWLMDYPAAVEVHADGPAGGTTCAGPVTAKTITFYDGAQSLSSQPDRGNPTLVKVYTDPVHYSATATTYDSSGRVTSVTDPLGRTTTTSYEPPTGIPFSAVTTTDPLGYKSTSVVSLPFGSAVEQTDPNGNLTQTSYDALGRLTEVAEPALPGTAGGTTVTQKFGYSLVFTGTGRVSQAPVVTSSQLLDDQDGGRWVDSYAYLDGYGRTRQTDTASPYGDGRIAAVASYDARGLTFAASLPFWTSGKPGSGMIDVAADAIPSLTTTTYDGLQRPVQENLESMGRVKWHTGYRYAADVTVVTPPAGGATATWTDAYGRTVKIQQNYPVRRGSVPLNLATTRYGYNDAGQLATITGPDGAVTSYGYDWAGNKTSADDPDAGDTAYTYDAAGQLTSQTDADGVTTSTTYDELGRRTGLWDGNPVTGTRLAAWTYDTAPGGKGMLATSASYSGGKETYGDTVAGYDPRGEVTGEKITIPPGDVGLAGSYSYGYGYDEAGNQVSMAYPAAGGLSQETVTTGYDAQGLPDSLASGTGGGYVQASSYGPAGRLTGRTLGGTPAAPAVTRGYAWDESTGNLAGVTTATRGGGQIQDDTYTYDPAGDLLSDHDQTAGQWQCYGYDQFPRLTQAWTARTGCGSGVRGYDPAQPGAYQQSFSYGIAGNTTALTTGTATTTPQVTRYTYPAFSQPHPHAPVSVGAASFAYDRDGNLTRQASARTRQLYDWDPLSQLASVTSYQSGQAARETSFAYDSGGDRLIRRDPDGAVTLYLPGMDLASDGSAVTVTRYYAIAGTTIGTRTAGPGGTGSVLGWLTGNPQGSPQYAITADGASSSGRQHYLPYGGLNGARTVTVTDRAFLGRPLDDSTGLIADGARYYNPATGLFISPDPVITPADPGTLNAYAYAGDNPATQADPTGLCTPAVYGRLSTCGQGRSTLGAPPGSPPGPPPGTITQPPPLCTYAPWQCGDTGTGSSGDGAGTGSGGGGCGILSFTPSCISGDFDQTRHEVASGWDWAEQVTGSDAMADCLAHPTLDACVNDITWYGMSAVNAFQAGLDPVTDEAEANMETSLSTEDTVTACGESFSASTRVLLASGKTVPISRLEPGDQVLATSIRTGRTQAEAVAAVLVNHDSDLLDLKIRAAGRAAVIDTTSSHLFWIPDAAGGGSWARAGALRHGTRLRTPTGIDATVAGTWTPRARTGWMWDLTIPGSNDHDFYVLGTPTPATPSTHTNYAEAATTAILVHNAGPCGIGNTLRNWSSQRYQFGDQHFLLDKGDLAHILERHMPEYWDGSAKASQSFFDNDTSIQDVQDAIGSVLSQNRDTLISRGSTGLYQIQGSYSGTDYVLGLNNGHIGQFYPGTLP